MDPFAANILGVQDLVQNRTNKVGGSGDSIDESTGDKIDVLDVDMDENELLKLRDERIAKQTGYKTAHDLIASKNLESYLGKNKNGQFLGGDETITANLQFEAEETFLPAALAKNPEPVVFADNTEEGNSLSTSVRTMLTFHSYQLALRDKIGVMVRQWSVNHLGVLKPGWNKEINDISLDNRKIEEFYFDPEGHVDVFGDFSSWLGEPIKVSAKKLVELFPKHENYIRMVVDDKMGTECTYVEWWDDDFCFITFKDKVLDKFKNPFYRYPEPATDEMGQPALDEMTGEQTLTEPRNHFPKPKKPYVFLSVFSLQSQPHDLTGLIEQNIPNQRRVTRREDQIDYNASAMNNSYALSEDNFNQETGKQFVQARKKGNPVLIPQGGDIDKAIKELNAQEIPSGLFIALQNDKDNLRSSWGIVGITSSNQDEDKTVRGEIIKQDNDTSRIGGGIGTKLERVANSSFDWFAQLYHVFYDEQHFAAIMGSAKAVEYVTLSNQDLDRQLIISVSADSMRPRDQVTEMNLAQSLFDKGAIGPKTLLKMIDFPNPDEAAADGVMFRLDPQAYFQMNFPEYAQQLQQQQQQNAMLKMQNDATGAGMTAAAGTGGPAPEAVTEPPAPTGVSAPPDNISLSTVPMPPIPQA